MIDNALDFEGLKYYDGKNKDYIQEQIKELIDSLPDSIREYSHKAIPAPTTALDELTGAGIWYEYNKVCTGVPTELENTTIIALIKNETVSNITIQTLTTISNGVILSWQRRYTSTNGWGVWYRCINSNDMAKLRTMYTNPSAFGCGTTDTTLTLLTMINKMDAKSHVRFWINNSGQYTSIYNEILTGIKEKYPDVANIYGNVDINKTDGSTVVTVYDYSNPNKVYTAHYSSVNSVGWSGWEKVASGTDLSKKVGIAAQYTTITPTNSISDVLDIDKSDPYAEKNQPKKVYQMTTDTTVIANMPDAYPVGKGFVGMRFVHYFSSTNILVELVAFPSGRRWYNNYVTNAWKGWTCEPANANNDTISAVRDDLEEIGDTITANVVEVGGNDNITVYATLCLQKLSATKCNLFISYKITANTETSNSVFEFMSAEKIKTALGVTTLTCTFDKSQVTFTPVFENSNGDLDIINPHTSLGIMGYTGIKAFFEDDALRLGRYYTDTGAYGSCPLPNKLFKPNTYGQINFYGASYSI